MSQNPLRQLSAYDRQHLVAHLAQAGRSTDLHRLLALEFSESPENNQVEQVHNAWYSSRAEHNATAAYLEDLARAWELVERETGQQVESGEPAGRLGLLVRYALLRGSISSLAMNLPPSLVVALGRKGIWPLDQALTYGRQNPEPADKAQALADLAPLLAEPEKSAVLQEALEAARRLTNQTERAILLTTVGTKMEEPERAAVVQEALEVAGSFEDEFSAPGALARVALLLDEPQRSEVLDQALGRAYGLTKDAGSVVASVLGLMAPHMKPEQLRRALSIGEQIEDESNRAQAMGELAPYLAEELVQSALSGLRFYYDSSYAESARAALGPRLLPPEEVLVRVRKGDYGDWASDALRSIADRLTPELQSAVLNEIEKIQVSGEYFQTILVVAPRLPDLQRAFDLTLGIPDRSIRLRAMRTLAPRLDQSVMQTALHKVAGMADSDERTDMLEILTPYLSKTSLEQALRAATPIRDGNWQAIVLADYLESLPEEARGSAVTFALEAAFSSNDFIERGRALQALAPHMTAEHWPRVLQGMTAYGRSAQGGAALDYFESLIGNYQANDALEAFAPYLPKWAWEQVVAQVLEIEAEDVRRDALERIALYHPEPKEMVVVAQQAGQTRNWSLALLAPRLSDEQFEQAFEAVLSLEDEKILARRLPPILPGLNRHQLIDVLDRLEAMRDASRVVEILQATAPHLSPNLAARVVGFSRRYSYQPHWIKAGAALVPQLDEPEQSQIVAEIHALACRQENWLTRTECLEITLELLSYLSTSEREQAVRMAQQALEEMHYTNEDNGGYYQARVWAALAPHLPETDHHNALNTALNLVSGQESVSFGKDALFQLIPYLQVDQLSPAFEIAQRVHLEDPQETDGLKMFAALEPRFGELSRENAFRLVLAALQTVESNERAITLRLVSSFAKTIQQIGGPSAGREIAQAVLDCSRWWP